MNQNNHNHEDTNTDTDAHHDNVYHVIINGEQKETRAKELSFHDVCKLAFPDGRFDDNIIYTVSFCYPDGTEGSMVKHELLETNNGIIFHVGNTDKS